MSALFVPIPQSELLQSDMMAAFWPTFVSPNEQQPIPQQRNCANCLNFIPVLKQLACSHGICHECFEKKQASNSESGDLLACDKCISEYSTGKLLLSEHKIHCENCTEEKKISDFWACFECADIACSLCALKVHREHKISQLTAVAYPLAETIESPVPTPEETVVDSPHHKLLIGLANTLHDMFEKITDLVLQEAKNRLDVRSAEVKKLERLVVQNHLDGEVGVDFSDDEKLQILAKKCTEIISNLPKICEMKNLDEARFEILGHTSFTLACSIASCLFLDVPDKPTLPQVSQLTYSKSLEVGSIAELDEEEINDVLEKFQKINENTEISDGHADDKDKDMKVEETECKDDEVFEEEKYLSAEDADETESSPEEPLLESVPNLLEAQLPIMTLLPTVKQQSTEESEVESVPQEPLHAVASLFQETCPDEEKKADEGESVKEESVECVSNLFDIPLESTGPVIGYDKCYSDTEIDHDKSSSEETDCVNLPPAYSTLSLYPKLSTEDTELFPRVRKRLAPSAPPPTHPVVESLPTNPEFKARTKIFGSKIVDLCERENSCVPTFVVSVLDLIEREGLHTEGLYRISGNFASITNLKAECDTGDYEKLMKADDVHTLTGLFKSFLRELEEPLIPDSVKQKFVFSAKKSEITAQNCDRIKKQLNSLPKSQHDTLFYILSHLKRVSEQSSHNMMNVHSLAVVFGPTLFGREDVPYSPLGSHFFGRKLRQFGKKRQDKKKNKRHSTSSAIVEDFRFSEEETAKSGWEETRELILQGMIVEFLINELENVFA